MKKLLTLLLALVASVSWGAGTTVETSGKQVVVGNLTVSPALAFDAWFNADFPVPEGVWTNASYPVDQDPSNMVSEGVFVVPAGKSGYWFLKINCYWGTAPVGTELKVGLRKNTLSGWLAIGSGCVSSATSTISTEASIVTYLAEGDIVYPLLFQNGSGTTVSPVFSGTSNLRYGSFSGVRLH